VVQEAWLGVIRQLGAFEGRSSLRTWAFRILMNVATTRGVKEHRITPVSSLARDDDAQRSVDPSRFRSDDDPQYPGNWTAAGRPQRWDDDPESGVLRVEIRTLVSAAVGRYLSGSAKSSCCATCTGSTATKCAACSA
jgi:RNA polymerase sigma-70 factor (ECF subfamily)